MGKQNFPFGGDGSPISPASARSVLDRANDLFHFEKAIRGDALPPLDIPAEMIPPAPPVPAPAPALEQTAPGMAPERAAEAAGTALVAVPRARDWKGPMQVLDREAMAEAGYLVPGAPITRTGEEFRIIKRELLARIRGSRQQEAIPNGNIILVASAHAGDGKTFCSVNLALSLAAESGLEVLLIDADFAKAEIASTLGLTPGKGMMDALADPHLPVDELVIRTDIPSFFVLPAGQGNDKDAEYLASSRMDAVIAALVAGRPDRVLIFDSPPLLAASPAAVLAGHVGQTVLVVRADRTSESALRDAAGLLKECQHVQLLLNGVKFSPSGRRFGSYYGTETE